LLKCAQKDSGIAFNTYSVMRSKALWGDPENFRPERFLGPDGKLNGKEEYIGISWGHGMHIMCTGIIIYIANNIR